MLSFDPDQQSHQDNYRLMIASVIPRPIAFVTTQSKEGVLNGAPFSYFSVLSTTPPLLSISVHRKQGVMKDTARNAIDQQAFVVHIVDRTNVEAINQTAASLPPDQSEITLAGLTPVPSESISVPGVKEAKIRMECVLEQVINLPASPADPVCDVLIGRVVRFHVAKEVMENGYIQAEKLDPVSRLAGHFYATLGDIFSLERPE